MSKRLRKTMLIFLTTVLAFRAVFMPIGMVYAETMIDTGEQGQVELPPMKDYLEEENASEPRFSFKYSQMKGTIEEPLHVKLFSNQEVYEVRVFLPEEATLLKDQLSVGVSIDQGEQSSEWIVRSESAQNTFVIPLVFEKAGSYELSVEETIAHLKISDQDNKIVEDYLLSEVELPDNSPKNQENSNLIEENTSKSSTLDQIRMVFDTQGNLISGDSNFYYSDIARIRLSENSTLVRENSHLTRITNVGYFSGRKIDVLFSGIPSHRINLLANFVSIAPRTPRMAFKEDYTITAVYSGSNQVVNAKILFQKQYQHPRFNSRIHLRSVFRIAVPQSSRTSVNISYNQVVLRSVSIFERYSGDHILNNGATITTEGAAIGSNLASGYIFFNRLAPVIPTPTFEGKVYINHINIDSSDILHTESISGEIGTSYVTTPMDDENYVLVSSTDNSAGIFKDEKQIVNFYYRSTDSLDPETEVEPENEPELPEDQAQLSIDFISSFNFGSQAISVHDQTYYAKPQHLRNEDGTVTENEERPNYVQISDQRSENERNGWELAVTQKEQFKSKENQILNGASLRLSNQQVISDKEGTAPDLQSITCTLVPGNRRTLLKAQGSEGTGTWIYRFGDEETAGESVALDVPRGVNPESTTYFTTLIWELSEVPSN